MTELPQKRLNVERKIRRWAEVQKPLATVAIGGFISAMLLSLYVFRRYTGCGIDASAQMIWRSWGRSVL